VEPGLGHAQGRRRAATAGIELVIKGLRHYTVSQLLAASFDLRNTVARLGPAEAVRPRCGTTPTPSPKPTGVRPPGRAGPGPGDRR